MRRSRRLQWVTPVAACIGALCNLRAANVESAGTELWSHGTFENLADARPPKGWVLWGDEKYKDPANYTIDAVNPRAGKGCFRLFQPRDTGGYVNMDPSLAIRPKRGMMYEISFWVRSDVANDSALVVEGYESADLNGWRAVARRTFQPTADWTPVSLNLHEGWDFLVGRENLLMTALMPSSADRSHDKTLWIDDFRVVERPSDRAGRLSDPASVEADPLRHRLSPGTELRVTVDAEKRLRRIEEPVGGVSFHRVAGWMGLPFDRDGRYTLPPEQEMAIRELRLPMTRFYALGDEAFPLEEAIDKAADVCRKVGVPLETVVLEFEVQDASKTLPPETWARGVKHSMERGYGFRYWEVSNEPYAFGTPAFPDKDSYLKHFLAVSRAIREIQPQAHVGLAAWRDDLLQLAAGQYNFVVKHHYVFHPSTQTAAFEDVVLGANYDKLGEILHLNAYLRACNPGRDVFQYDTEWGLHSEGTRGATHNNRNANVMGTLHRAVRLLHYAREGMLKGASAWELFGPRPEEGYTFGFVPKDAAGQYFMFYWLFYHFNRHVGEWALETDGTAPWYKPAEGVFTKRDASGPLTPMLASLDATGKTLYVVVVNGSWEQTVPCEITLASFPATQATGVYLSDDDLDAYPLVKRKEDFVKPLPLALESDVLRCDLPPHSTVFIDVARKGE